MWSKFGLTYHWISFRRGPRDQGPESDVEALARPPRRAAPRPRGQDRRNPAALRPDRRGSLRGALEGIALLTLHVRPYQPRGQSWWIGSRPSQSTAASRTASKIR